MIANGKLACFSTLTVVGWLCIITGCSHTNVASRKSNVTSPLVENHQLSLSEEQEQRAQLLARYATGLSKELSKSFDEALSDYLTVVEFDPQNAPLIVRVASHYLSKREYALAIGLLESGVETNPQVTDLWYWLGIAYKASDQEEASITALRKALKLEPTKLLTLQTLAEIYLQQDAYSDVALLLERAMRVKSEDAQYWLKLGDILSFATKLKPSLRELISQSQVRECYNKAQKIAPIDSEILLRMATLHTEDKKFDLAAEAYMKVLESNPQTPHVRERLAFCLVQSDQKEEAIKILEEIIQRDPIRHEIYNYLGDLYEEMGENERAITNFRQSLVANATQLEPALRMALLELKLEHFDNALKTLTEAKKNFPTTYQIPYFTGLVYSDQKLFDRAVSSFAEAELLLEASSEGTKPDAALYFYYGAALERIGKLDEAADKFKKCIEIDPERHAAYNYLGYMWAEKGIHLEESLTYIKKALEKDPNNGAYLDSLGWVLFKLERYEEALQPLTRAAEVVNDDPTVLHHLADLLLKLGKTEEAIAKLHDALEIDSMNKEIIEKLSTLVPNEAGTKQPKE